MVQRLFEKMTFFRVDPLTRARRRIKRTLLTRNIRRRTRCGRKCLPRTVIRRKNKWASIPFSGADTTWRRWSASLRIAA